MDPHPRVAITLGDPRGIGPEVTLKAVQHGDRSEAEIILVGPEGLPGLSGYRLEPVGSWCGEEDAAEAGRLSYRAIERAVELVGEGRVDAIVTAPINKAALAAAGYGWPGHTEMLRDLTGVDETALCLTAEETDFGSPLRVVLVTGHMALREVPAAYTADRLERTALLAHAGLHRWWALQSPRLAVCSFNPHASDGGLFGDEEERVIHPATRRLRERGLEVLGPYPADTVFVRAMQGHFDAVLAPYHDVGMTAIKTAAFGRAVNVTLGLPFPRTSPDHGTALDIAGTGRADPASMILALELGVRFARRALTATSDPGRFTGE